MWRRWGFIRQAKLLLLRFLRLRGQPDEIAKGFALGIFIGMTPTLGFQMILAVFFAMLLRENKLAAVIGVWISNPVTAPFIYAAEYETGRFILGMPHLKLPAMMTVETIQHFGYELMIPMCLGSLIYGILLGAVSYAMVLRMVPTLKTCRIPRWPRPFQRKHQRKHGDLDG
ncbi:DUF2062 domain-containing protein [Desulfuromonas acetoxidans]|uniref:DUF2062 domain-containing protein n=2 Tax=Desulfuromonas acetoxidans TaxID=891 RepID=Q1JYS8_DESA6|nr:DUF2062 domain-containing protein [Desulfuromonas acetoxidans]EAT15337.1 conserved hypothetical protein [Desulfuromonas acetoxidans DSM 684]MBF0644939.1 DUF2062 domain-containing protein [Desulfuromonas acetoxidans]NVD25456.1 DUF2062 domain-containing protein [Desulfuromonas acetoxidans]NVE17443.1 DUF2062 domain-containing protein [Desulfuromonas acetoxidans]